MENRGLIFIPDISGFTRFVNETEIDHSRQIIQELLESLINANNIGLEISEIEGDAILFYKYGEAPGLKELYNQVEKMFCTFHRQLSAYKQRRLCQCTACKSAASLTLKVISHYGEFTGYNVKNFNKLIGKDIIVAHQLLKNDIDQHEYWLVTEGLAKDREQHGLPQWINWNTSLKQTESGQIPFQYTQLGELKKDLPPEPLPDMEIPNKVKMFSVSKEFDIEINTLFFTAVNFSTRGKWMVGVKSADQVSHILPQIGTRHRCVLEKGHVIMYTSKFSHLPDRILYAETDEKKESATYMNFEKTPDGKTRLTIDFYMKKNPVLQLMFNLTMKKKIEKGFVQSLENLERLARNVRLPVEV